MPLIEQQDPEKVATDFLAGLIPTLPQTPTTGTSPWTWGTVVKPGTTPTNAVRVRVVGGVDEQRVADRPRLDFRVWTDGSYMSEGAAKKVARVLIAHLRRDLRAVVVTDPIALPDPADNTKTHVLFTIELLTRGVQS